MHREGPIGSSRWAFIASALILRLALASAVSFNVTDVSSLLAAAAKANSEFSNVHVLVSLTDGTYDLNQTVRMTHLAATCTAQA